MVRPVPGAPGRHRENVLRPPGEQEPIQPGGCVDQLPELLALACHVRMILVHIGHTGTKDGSPVAILRCLLIPAQGLLPVFFPKETPRRGGRWSPHPMAVMVGNALGIAEAACFRHLETAPPGVKGVALDPGPIGEPAPRPLNTSLSHDFLLLSGSPGFLSEHIAAPCATRCLHAQARL